MNKTSLTFTALLVSAALIFSAQAQQGKNQQENQSQQGSMMQRGSMGTMQQGNRPMMQRGMMQGNRPMMQRGMGMMQNWNCPMGGPMMRQRPMVKYMTMVNRLPRMQQQLSLTADQTDQLIDLQADFQKKLSRHQTIMDQTHQELQSLLDNMAPADQIKQQLQKCANARIEMSLTAYETAGKMKTVLTADQKNELKNIIEQEWDMMWQRGMMQQGGTMQQGGMMQQGQGGMMQR